MKRISKIERKYVLNALKNEFGTSVNNVFNSLIEKKFAEMFDVKYAIAHVNGTQTMHTALAALGIQPKDEVIVPPLTMSSTAIAVLQNNSIPIFADVDHETFNIAPKSIRERITEKTKAIISVSLYGLPPDYDELLKICKEYNLFLIEDNAECFLGKYKGRLAGQFGHFASFSFQASKHLTCGEGGMLITNDEIYANNARKFSSLGYAGVDANKGKISRDDIQNPQYNRHIALGYNYRMSEIAAALLLGQLHRADELVERRIQVAKIFNGIINNTSLLKPQAEPEGYKNTYWSYSLVLNTDNPETDWFKFRNLFLKNGGDGYYAAWKLSYHEPLFQNIVSKFPGIWQHYNKELCPNAEFLQPRMIQMKTNYWNFEAAQRQAEILYKTISTY